MWGKLLGSAVLLAAGGLASLRGVQREKQRLRAVDGWIDLILFIRGQIDCYLRPLEEILACADPALLSRCMAPVGVRSLPQVLKHSAHLLDEETARLLSRFVGELGSTYREEQLKRCDFYADALRERRERLFSESPARIRLAVTLSLSAALSAVILLW